MTVQSPAQLYARAVEAFQQQRDREALHLLDALLKQAPGHADGWNLAGVLCNRAGDADGAVRCFSRAVALGAAAGTRVNLGFALLNAGRLQDAMRAYQDALRLDPASLIAWQKLADLQARTGAADAALASHRRAFALAPRDPKTVGDALELRRALADWDPALPPSPQDLLQAFATAPRSDVAPLLLLALPEASAADLRRAGALFARTQWGHALAQPPLAAPAQAHGGRLRIGYLSSDFRDHAVAYLTTELIAAHDRAAVEVFAYAHRPAPGDPWRAAIHAAAEHVVELDGLDDHAAALRIARDRIDVLVDLNGYTRHTRSGIVARRPAPTVASWLGYVGTLGEPRMADYLIGDAITLPDAQDDACSERPARLPRCFQPNGRLAALEPAPARADEGLPARAVVFCSFNQTFKLHPALWDDWCAILRRVPDSVLWLAPPVHPGAAERLRLEAERRGVAGARLVFAAHRPRARHLARLALADLALDTWPYNSGTTASDALRAGVPLLAFPGDRYAGRMAASLLAAAGLDDCVLPDRAALVERAVALGTDAAARAELRARLLATRAQRGLFDPDGFARDLERLYRAMHAQACAGLRAPITLAPDDRPA